MDDFNAYIKAKTEALVALCKRDPIAAEHVSYPGYVGLLVAQWARQYWTAQCEELSAKVFKRGAET